MSKSVAAAAIQKVALAHTKVDKVMRVTGPGPLLVGQKGVGTA